MKGTKGSGKWNPRGKKEKLYSINEISQLVQTVKQSAPTATTAREPGGERTLSGQSDVNKTPITQETLERVAGLSNVSEYRSVENKRKISMVRVQMKANNGTGYQTIPALVDTGAIPASYISLKTVQRLGLQDNVRVDTKRHDLAGSGNSFESIGYLDADIRLGNRSIDPIQKTRLLVSPLETELILGLDFLEKVGASISLVTHKVYCLKLKRSDGGNVTLPMVRLDEWRQISAISGQDWWNSPAAQLPPPEDYQKRYPGKNLRQIAEILDKIPPEKDWTPERGQQYIDHLLKTKYKELTTPPTGHNKIKPVRLRVQEKYKDTIIHVPERARPSKDWDRIEEQTQKWAKEGKVVPSTSPWNTRHVVAPKATPPYFRLAQDFRRINRILEKNKWPVRKIDYMVEELSRKRWKSTLDWLESYLQIPVAPVDQPKLAFSTRSGKWQFTVVPFGIECSGDLFAQRKSEVIGHEEGSVLLWTFLWTYIDDDAIGTDTVVCHVFVLEVIFDRLLLFEIKIKVPKCTFIQEIVKFLGYLVGWGKVMNDPAKGNIIAKVPKPENMKDVRSFLGMAAWHLKRFAPTYAELAATITSKFRGYDENGQSFQSIWDKEAQDAFDAIKDLCRTQLINTRFRQDCKDTKLWVDWSKKGISAVLTQDDDVVGVWGRACTPAEARSHQRKGKC